MYYGVYGKNGGGVYYSWSKVLESKPYIKSFKVKKFTTQANALEYVIGGLTNDYKVVYDNHLNKKLLEKRINFFSHLRELMIY